MIKTKKKLAGKLTFADGSVMKYRDAAQFIQAVREELPYRSTTGLEIEVITSDPQTRKAVEDLIFNLYGEKNPRRIEDYSKTGPTMTM